MERDVPRFLREQHILSRVTPWVACKGIWADGMWMWRVFVRCVGCAPVAQLAMLHTWVTGLGLKVGLGSFLPSLVSSCCCVWRPLARSLSPLSPLRIDTRRETHRNLSHGLTCCVVCVCVGCSCPAGGCWRRHPPVHARWHQRHHQRCLARAGTDHAMPLYVCMHVCMQASSSMSSRVE